MKKPPATTDRLIVHASRLADLLGVHRNTVGNWTDSGMPVVGRSGRTVEVDLGEALPWIRARDLASFEARLAEATSTPDIDRERARKLQAEADIAEMDRDKQRGDLVSRTDAERVWGAHVLQVRARLLSLPAHARVRGLSAEDAAIVDGLIRTALESLTAEVSESDEATA